MRYYLAPLEGITGYIFRNAHTRLFTPADKYFSPFLVPKPNSGKQFSAKEKADILPEHNQNIHLVPQIMTNKAADFIAMTKALEEYGYQEVNLNLGCPSRTVVTKGRGAGFLSDPETLQFFFDEVFREIKIKISVKTRIGFNKDELDVWLPELLSERPAAITVHARTKKEMSLVPARWEYVARAVELARGTGVLIIGNGDVRSMEEARQRVAETGCDGVMIGRGLFGNPWFFAEQEVSLDECLRALIEHTELYESLFHGQKSFEIMKKHYKAYAHGFDGAHGLRAALMECHDAPSVRERVEDFLLHRAAAAIDKPPID